MKQIRVLAFTPLLLLISTFIWVSHDKITKQNNPIMSFFMQVDAGDKLGHFLMFGGLSLLLNLSLQFKNFSLQKINIYKGTLITACLSLLDEFTQLFISTRQFEIADIIANISGIFTFYLLTIGLEKIFANYRRLRMQK